MRIAVTGATGYIGRSFINLHKNDLEIVAVGRGEKPASLPSGVEYKQSDYNSKRLREVLKGCEAVVHLAYAMATKENEQGGIESYRSSMEATENILEASSGLGIRNIIFASSRLVYPNRSDIPFAEECTVKPTTYYGKSKVMMEQLCEQYNVEGKAMVKILRFGQIIGADMSVRGLFSVFMEKAEIGEPLTLIGSNIRDYIYVKDTCKALAAALEHPSVSGIFNISMGKGIDNRNMAEAIIKETGSSSQIIVDTDSMQATGDRIVLDVTKASEKLGFKCQYDTINKIVEDILLER